MSEVVVSEFMDQDAVDWLSARHSTHYDSELVNDPARLETLARDARALIVRNRTQVTAKLVDACPALVAVGRLGVGLDNIDTAACEARAIAVMPATGGNTVSVAEYVLTAALMLRRGAWLSSHEVLGGGWPRARLMGREVQGARLGLVGFGTIARATAERARALGMEVLAHDPLLPETDPAWATAERAETLAALLADSDVVSLHVPLTDTTRGLIGARDLAQMRVGAGLINTARGGIVDESALAAALRDGPLGGAALDVFADEPLPAGSPLAEAPNLVATPHIAGVTDESNTRISWITVRNVARVLEGTT